MIVYLDTSSLMKLYVEEDGADAVRQLVEQSDTVAVSWVAYAEARSAFARRYREGGVPLQEYREKTMDFENDWATYLAIDVSHEVIREAGELIEKHGLRALDAIHLASALALTSSQEYSPDPVVFSSADIRLLEAGHADGLATPDGL